MALQFTYATGTSGAVLVPAGCVVCAFLCVSSGGGTLTIAPGGAGNTGETGDAIPILAGVPFGRDYRDSITRDPLPILGAGTILTFASTDMYYVELAS